MCSLMLLILAIVAQNFVFFPSHEMKIHGKRERSLGIRVFWFINY